MHARIPGFTINCQFHGLSDAPAMTSLSAISGTERLFVWDDFHLWGQLDPVSCFHPGLGEIDESEDIGITGATEVDEEVGVDS